jgi:MFS family permease
LAGSKRLTLETYMIAVFLGTLDVAIITPGLALIMTEYRLSIHWAVWAVSLPLLFFSLALPVLESWADLYGRAKVFYVSLGLFAAGTLVAALSQEWVWFVWGRVIQAAGAGGVVPLVALQARRLLRVRQSEGRGRVFMVFGLGIAGLPVLSAGLVYVVGWRGLFILHLMLAVRMMLKSQSWLESDRSRRARMVGGESIFFFGLIVLFLMTAVTGTDLLGGWTAFLRPEVLPLWIMAAGLAVPLWMVEQQGNRTFFEEYLFSVKRLWLLHVQAALAGFIWMALALVPGWIVHLHRLPMIWIGLFLGYILFCSATAVPLVVLLSRRWSFRAVSSLGFLLSAAAFSTLAVTGGISWLFVALGILGGSLSATLASPVHRLLFERLPHRRVRGALTVLGMFRAAGGALGLVVMARLFSSLAPELHNWLLLPGSSTPLIRTAQQNVLILAAIASVIGWAVSLAIPRGDGKK